MTSEELAERALEHIEACEACGGSDDAVVHSNLALTYAVLAAAELDPRLLSGLIAKVEMLLHPRLVVHAGPQPL